MHSAIIPYLPGLKWYLDFLERLIETPEVYTTTFVVAKPVKDLLLKQWLNFCIEECL